MKNNKVLFQNANRLIYKSLWFFIILFFFPFHIKGQDKLSEKFQLSLNGFVKNDMFWDTRQTISAREDHFLLFPQEVKLDAAGADINKGMNFNFLSIQSRIAINFKGGGKVLNADMSGKIEADFFGQANDNINLLRLRHAYLKLNWTNTELMIGQYWIPMFVTDCFPGTISFNTGVPFQPFGRNPQIRISQKMGKVKFIAIANSQRDYVSRGPNPASPSTTLTSNMFIRNAGIPELSGQIHVTPSESLIFGFGGSYKQIKPQLVTPLNYRTDELVGSFNSFAFLKLKTDNVLFKLQGIYGQNMPDVLSIGGFGVSDSTDITKGYVSYSCLNTASVWADISTNGKIFQFGIFGGYSKNLGSKKDIIGPIYGLGTSIESVYRVSPRVSYKHNKVKFALEGEYTVANYGSAKDSKGVPINLTAASNFRLLFASYYFF